MTHILDTEKEVAEVEEYLSGLEGVTSVASFVGQGPLRYLLTLAPESPNSSYGHLLVSVDDFAKIDPMMVEALEWIREGVRENDVFDLVLLDYQMPEIDGLMLAAEIQKIHGAAKLPLVLLSSLRRQEVVGI